MTPAARVQAAIDVLDKWLSGSSGADRVLTAWGRQNRYAGSGDRRAIGDLVHDGLRRMRSAVWCAGFGPVGTVDATPNGRQILHGLTLLNEQDPEALFTGERYGPAILTAAERAGQRGLSDAPHSVRYDYPEWLADDFSKLPAALLSGMQTRAPFDLRVNELKSTVVNAISTLQAAGVVTVPIAGTKAGIRVKEGQRRLNQSDPYRDGLVEIQDAASQGIADISNAQPGQTALDLCAGGGGKTLALAAAMGNKGRLLAHDVAPARIAALPDRARRAGAIIELISTSDLAQLSGQCDLVLLDAPCSGSGTWRRNPDAKWRFTSRQLDILKAAQDQLLAQAIGLTAPGGRIVYATCSLLNAENDQRIAEFCSAHREWQATHICQWLPGQPGDGMFCSVLEKI